MSIKEKIDRIQKIDRVLLNIPLVPVVSLIGYKRLKEEKLGLIRGIINQGKRESKT